MAEVEAKKNAARMQEAQDQLEQLKATTVEQEECIQTMKMQLHSVSVDLQAASDENIALSDFVKQTAIYLKNLCCEYGKLIDQQETDNDNLNVPLENQSSSQKQVLRLHISGKNFSTLDFGTHSTCDPMVAAYLIIDGGEDELLGQTECMHGTNNPVFKHFVDLGDQVSMNSTVKFVVYEMSLNQSVAVLSSVTIKYQDLFDARQHFLELEHSKAKHSNIPQLVLNCENVSLQLSQSHTNPECSAAEIQHYLVRIEKFNEVLSILLEGTAKERDATQESLKNTMAELKNAKSSKSKLTKLEAECKKLRSLLKEADEVIAEQRRKLKEARLDVLRTQKMSMRDIVDAYNVFGFQQAPELAENLSKTTKMSLAVACRDLPLSTQTKDKVDSKVVVLLKPSGSEDFKEIGTTEIQPKSDNPTFDVKVEFDFLGDADQQEMKLCVYETSNDNTNLMGVVQTKVADLVLAPRRLCSLSLRNNENLEKDVVMQDSNSRVLVYNAPKGAKDDENREEFLFGSGLRTLQQGAQGFLKLAQAGFDQNSQEKLNLMTTEIANVMTALYYSSQVLDEAKTTQQQLEQEYKKTESEQDALKEKLAQTGRQQKKQKAQLQEALVQCQNKLHRVKKETEDARDTLQRCKTEVAPLQNCLNIIESQLALFSKSSSASIDQQTAKQQVSDAIECFNELKTAVGVVTPSSASPLVAIGANDLIHLATCVMGEHRLEQRRKAQTSQAVFSSASQIIPAAGSPEELAFQQFQRIERSLNAILEEKRVALASCMHESGDDNSQELSTKTNKLVSERTKASAMMSVLNSTRVLYQSSLQVEKGTVCSKAEASSIVTTLLNLVEPECQAAVFFQSSRNLLEDVHIANRELAKNLGVQIPELEQTNADAVRSRNKAIDALQALSQSSVLPAEAQNKFQQIASALEAKNETNTNYSAVVSALNHSKRVLASVLAQLDSQQIRKLQLESAATKSVRQANIPDTINAVKEWLESEANPVTRAQIQTVLRALEKAEFGQDPVAVQDLINELQAETVGSRDFVENQTEMLSVVQSELEQKMSKPSKSHKDEIKRLLNLLKEADKEIARKHKQLQQAYADIARLEKVGMKNLMDAYGVFGFDGFQPTLSEVLDSEEKTEGSSVCLTLASSDLLEGFKDSNVCPKVVVSKKSGSSQEAIGYTETLKKGQNVFETKIYIDYLGRGDTQEVEFAVYDTQLENSDVSIAAITVPLSEILNAPGRVKVLSFQSDQESQEVGPRRLFVHCAVTGRPDSFIRTNRLVKFNLPPSVEVSKSDWLSSPAVSNEEDRRVTLQQVPLMFSQMITLLDSVVPNSPAALFLRAHLDPVVASLGVSAESVLLKEVQEFSAESSTMSDLVSANRALQVFLTEQHEKVAYLLQENQKTKSILVQENALSRSRRDGLEALKLYSHQVSVPPLFSGFVRQLEEQSKEIEIYQTVAVAIQQSKVMMNSLFIEESKPASYVSSQKSSAQKTEDAVREWIDVETSPEIKAKLSTVLSMLKGGGINDSLSIDAVQQDLEKKQTVLKDFVNSQVVTLGSVSTALNKKLGVLGAQVPMESKQLEVLVAKAAMFDQGFSSVAFPSQQECKSDAEQLIQSQVESIESMANAINAKLGIESDLADVPFTVDTSTKHAPSTEEEAKRNRLLEIDWMMRKAMNTLSALAPEKSGSMVEIESKQLEELVGKAAMLEKLGVFEASPGDQKSPGKDRWLVISESNTHDEEERKEALVKIDWMLRNAMNTLATIDPENSGPNVEVSAAQLEQLVAKANMFEQGFVSSAGQTGEVIQKRDLSLASLLYPLEEKYIQDVAQVDSVLAQQLHAKFEEIEGLKTKRSELEALSRVGNSTDVMPEQKHNVALLRETNEKIDHACQEFRQQLTDSNSAIAAQLGKIQQVESSLSHKQNLVDHLTAYMEQATDSSVSGSESNQSVQQLRVMVRDMTNVHHVANQNEEGMRISFACSGNVGDEDNTTLGIYHRERGVKDYKLVGRTTYLKGSDQEMNLKGVFGKDISTNDDLKFCLYDPNSGESDTPLEENLVGVAHMSVNDLLQGQVSVRLHHADPSLDEELSESNSRCLVRFVDSSTSPSGVRQVTSRDAYPPQNENQGSVPLSALLSPLDDQNNENVPLSNLTPSPLDRPSGKLDFGQVATPSRQNASTGTILQQAALSRLAGLRARLEVRLKDAELY